jgi:hypothetical protein
VELAKALLTGFKGPEAEADPSWQSSKRNALVQATTLDKLEAQLKEVETLETKLGSTLRDDIEGILVTAGADQAKARLWALTGPITQMVVEAVKNYIGLLRFLCQMGRSGNSFASVKVALEYHRKELEKIRFKAKNRFQMVARVYAYLRDSKRSDFNPPGLHAERLLRMERASMVPQSRVNICQKCQTALIHGHLKASCLWRTDDDVKAVREAQATLRRWATQGEE